MLRRVNSPKESTFPKLYHTFLGEASLELSSFAGFVADSALASFTSSVTEESLFGAPTSEELIFLSLGCSDVYANSIFSVCPGSTLQSEEMQD